MIDKTKAFEEILLAFEVIMDYQRNNVNNGGFPLVYELCKMRGYANITIEDLYTIKELDMSMLGMTGFIDEIGYLETLESLNISGNYFKVLPESIWRLHNLKQLSLGSPVYGGNLIEEISPNIKNLQKLEILDISLCDNLTSLPQELLELQELSYLRMTQEHLLDSYVLQRLNNSTKCQVIFEETLPPIDTYV